MTALRHLALFALPAAIAIGSIAAAETPRRPVVLSTWRHGIEANQAAWKVLTRGGSSLDAVEAGARDSESDADNLSVGLGGLPDRDGNVTLDACIMNPQGECGSVAFLKRIENPISVARLVMEKTPHVMLVGEGALEFARSQGFAERELLTDKAREAWLKWQEEHPDAIQEREVNIENHDTIGVLAIDGSGDISGACTTSGLAWKMHGRVGDSPIIGAGLYVDNEVGGAAATGVGEAVIQAVGSFLVVEFMRQGATPEEACRRAVERVVQKSKDWRDIQVGFIALDKEGRVGAYAIQPGFEFALHDETGGRLIPSESRLGAAPQP